MPGTTGRTTATDSAAPVEQYFSVDNPPVVARRQVVSSAKCAACHQNLAFVHGGSRPATQECVICHNPTLTDGTSKQSVSLATQIHSIHRGDSLANPYILGTTNFQDVRFPGDLRDCVTCHLAGTYHVDNVGAQASVASPGGFTPTTGPIAAASLGCHDDKASASHALSNTTAIGEACLSCHGNNAAVRSGCRARARSVSLSSAPVPHSGIVGRKPDPFLLAQPIFCFSTSTSSFTAPALFCNAACSSTLSLS